MDFEGQFVEDIKLKSKKIARFNISDILPI